LTYDDIKNTLMSISASS
jgi:transcriptional regulator with XRE-family HTH domain